MTTPDSAREPSIVCDCREKLKRTSRPYSPLARLPAALSQMWQGSDVQGLSQGQRARCPVCHEDLSPQWADDAPAYLPS